ncbi:MAG: protein kinase [Candidatus Nanoarchaeia archaeon]|nr:protein kinase [Candidatus Nanoarchaeia archaeon]
MVTTNALLKFPEERKSGIDGAVEEILNANGYTVLEKKESEGATMTLYDVEYRKGSTKKRRIAKVPKTFKNENITAKIIFSKGNLDNKGVLILNEVKHPNIVEIYDSFNLGDRSLVIEEEYDAISLEDLVKTAGPITDPIKIGNIFSQLMSAVQYLHEEERILHRDIKPSNILIGKDNYNTVKLTDFQTAVKIEDLNEKAIPTRGGTAYTDPYLLNSLMRGFDSCGSMSTDMYSVGATLYFVLTGEKPFDYSFDTSPTGKPIKTKFGKLKIILRDGEDQIDEIDIDEHNKLLNEKLKNVPKRYRGLVRDLMEVGKDPYNFDNAYMAHSDFIRDLGSATKKIPIRWEKVLDNIKIWSACAGIMAGLVVGAQYIRISDKNLREREPTVFDTLTSTRFVDGSLEYITQDKNKLALEALTPYFKEIKQDIKKFDKKNEEEMFSVEFTDSRVTRLGSRISYSLMRSILMEPDQNKKREYGMLRLETSLAPVPFVARFTGGNPIYFSSIDNNQQIGLGLQYLRGCMGVNTELEDILVTYFCDSTDEVFEARKKADSPYYFDREMKIEGSDNSMVVKGYREYLSPVKRHMIDRAMALFYITDNEGKVHTELLDSNNRPVKELDAK